ncbi:hypothetical protein ACKI1S_49625, partial [Streptomyces galilaeus]
LRRDEADGAGCAADEHDVARTDGDRRHDRHRRETRDVQPARDLDRQARGAPGEGGGRGDRALRDRARAAAEDLVADDDR